MHKNSKEDSNSILMSHIKAKMKGYIKFAYLHVTWTPFVSRRSVNSKFVHNPISFHTIWSFSLIEN